MILSALKKQLIVLALLTMPFLAIPASATAVQPLDNACQSNSKAQASAVCQQAAGQGTADPISGPNGLIKKAANLIAVVAGIGAVVMIALSGFAYATSSGSPDKASKAKSRLIGATIGLAVVVASGIIVNYVEDKIIR